MGKDSYDDLIFQLGDLARERLANKANRPRAMERVLKAEEALLARREEMEELERQMNDEDGGYRDFQAQQEAERLEQQEIVKKWRRAVEGIEGRTKNLRKKMSTQRATLRYQKEALKKAEERHKDLEMTQHHEEAKIALSRENLKKFRLAQMRMQRDIEELEAELETILTPRPGQPGAAGILAHKRLMEMEDEAEARKEEHDQLMAELDAQLAAKDQEVAAAEDYLDQAAYILGEEVYSQRIPDPALAALYLRVDKAS
ncbi:MAG: hypothetical protein HYZ28_17020 [Myxococcales bacterium]|nr:hypothetical protein [Myxococcales bacterium]